MIRVIGLGEPNRGDDGVGHVVVARVPPQPQVETVLIRDAADLIDLVTGVDGVILVDAVADGGPPGRVRLIDEAKLKDIRAFSSHAMSVAEALSLARVLGGELPPITIIGITVDPEACLSPGLSPGVQESVGPGVAQVTKQLNLGT